MNRASLLTGRVALGSLLLLSSGTSLWAENYGDVRNLIGAHTKSHFVQRPYRTLAEWSARKTGLQKQIFSAAGLFPLPPRTPLLPRRAGRVDHGTFITEKVTIEPLPGFLLAGNLYLPKESRRKAPAVLIPHGHWKNGRIHNESDYSVPLLGANLARQGYVAFAYDMVGYNDTKQLKHDFGSSPEEQLWSWNPLGVQLWSGIRALDFLESLSEVDGQRIAVTGASGGGTQTMLLAAVDQRVAVSIAVNMVSTTFQGDDACEMAPGLRIGTNNVEIAALAAPRPMLLISSTQDWTKLTPEEEYPAILAIYQLYGQREERVASKQIDAPHNYNRESRLAAYAFLHRHLQRRRNGADFQDLPLENLNPERLLFGEQISETPLPDQKQLFANWKEMSARQIAALPHTRQRTILRQVAGIDWPNAIVWRSLGEQLLLERGGSGERVPVRLLGRNTKGTAVVVDADGSRAKKLAGEGWQVLLVHPYQTGAAESPRPPARGDHLTFHRSDDAKRVQDIVTGLAATGGTGPVRLECEERAAIWCTAAAAMAERRVEVNIPGTFHGTSEEFEKMLFIPGLQRAGGWRAIRELATSRRN